MSSPVKKRAVRAKFDGKDDSDSEVLSDYEGEDYSGQQVIQTK